MYIAIYAPGMPFDGDTIRMGKSLGGSETAAYYIAKELAAIGHNVVMFTNSQQTGRWDNVKYEWLGNCTHQTPLGDRFHYVMQTPSYDVVIAQRHPHAFLHNFNSKLNIWWLHDLALHRNNPGVQNHLINVDRIFTVSEFHKEQVSKVYSIDKEYIYATKNGVDYSFEAFKSDNENRIPRSLFFAARPERGLENLVGKDGLMEELKDCHLYVCGYNNTTQQMKSYYDYLLNRCRELPNVTNLGFLGKNALYNYMRSMMLYVYPTSFKDTSCIAALESQACGLPFVGPKVAALPETLKDGGANLLSLKANGKINKKKFIKTIRGLLENDNAWRSLHKKTKNIRQPWEDIAKDWSELFKELLEKKSCTNKLRLFLHFERNSDISAATKAGANTQNFPTLKENYGFFLDGMYKEHYKAYYEYEKARGVNYGPEDLTGNRRFEYTCKMIEKIKPKSILDYGCAHGHYVINLAKRFPDIDFTGVDLEKTNIEKAIKWSKSEKLDNRCDFFEIDNLFKIREAITGMYDCILCQEVLEHVENPNDTIEKLNILLRDNGKFIISVPYGPWEALGYEQHKGWRAHIHMLERADLHDMFGKQKDYEILALPHRNDLGHYLVKFEKSDEPIGEINYDRKIKTQSPRQTLSVCMIARDAEFEIGRTLNSIKSVANEIIVGVDKKTTDNTRKIAESFGAKIIDIDSPIDVGFDTVRNITIAEATCDWIMWIDCDEIFTRTENLTYYLRDNCYNGYAIQQMHYAVEPACLFKTDLPVRIFRNGLGMKFFGFVHEHPELELNKGPGKIIVLGDCAIMHTGYYSEDIRRKRFNRNFPLMIKDREKNPGRKLGIFLWCRDVAHLIKYTLERNGGILTDDVVKHANTVIDTWRILVETGEQRMIIDGLTYYSEAVRALGNGINYKLQLASTPLGREFKKPVTIDATFANTKDIKTLTDLLMKNDISIYDEEYY